MGFEIKVDSYYIYVPKVDFECEVDSCIYLRPNVGFEIKVDSYFIYVPKVALNVK